MEKEVLAKAIDDEVDEALTAAVIYSEGNLIQQQYRLGAMMSSAISKINRNGMTDEEINTAYIAANSYISIMSNTPVESMSDKLSKRCKETIQTAEKLIQLIDQIKEG